MRLTPAEYELLRALSVNARRVVTYESELRQGRGQNDLADVRQVGNIVERLRRKPGDD